MSPGSGSRYAAAGGGAGRQPQTRGEGEGKPELAAVLDHYEVPYSPTRVSQMAHCPLHEDRTPSLSLNLRSGLWKFHSCGRGGDSYTLIMELEGIDFVRARTLAAAVGLAAAGPGGSDHHLSGSRYATGRTISTGPRYRPRSGGRVSPGRGG
jgi:hypothetical protein